MANENTILYRDYGGSTNQGGGFASTSPTPNKTQAKIDAALLPEWENTSVYETQIFVPSVTKLNIGKVALQTINSTGTVLEGGADQILLPQG